MATRHLTISTQNPIKKGSKLEVSISLSDFLKKSFKDDNTLYLPYPNFGYELEGHLLKMVDKGAETQIISLSCKRTTF